MTVSIDTMRYGIKGALDKHFVGYKYYQVDYNTEAIEDTILFPGPRKFFIFKTHQNLTYQVPLEHNYTIDYTDVKEKVKFAYGIDKEKKKIYWKYDGSTYY